METNGNVFKNRNTHKLFKYDDFWSLQGSHVLGTDTSIRVKRKLAIYSYLVQTSPTNSHQWNY